MVTTGRNTTACKNKKKKKTTFGRRGAMIYAFGLRLPMFQPQERSVLTTLGVMAAVRGTRIKMKLLWMA